MKKTNYKKLESICGGTTLTSSIVNSFTNIVRLLMTAGQDLGSSIRRIGEDKICPLQ